MFKLTGAHNFTYLVSSDVDCIADLHNHCLPSPTSVLQASAVTHLPVGTPALSYMYNYSVSVVHLHQLYVLAVLGFIANGLAPQSAAVISVLLLTFGPDALVTVHQVAPL